MKEYFKRNKWSLLAATTLLLALIVVVGVQIYRNYGDKFDTFNLFLLGAEKVLLILLVVIFLKIMFAAEATYTGFKELFLKALQDKEMLKKFSKDDRIGIARKIGEMDADTIEVKDIPEESRAKQMLEANYLKEKAKKKESRPYILLESNETQTLYESGHFIVHKQVTLKMMEEKELYVEIDFIPFDKKIHDDPKQDDYWLNRNKNRWPECQRKNKLSLPHKTFRFYTPDNNRESPIAITPGIDIRTDKDGKRWLRFTAETSHKIEKGRIFLLEVVITDYIDFGEDYKERRKEYFQNDIPYYCGVRRIKFQTEIYNEDANDRFDIMPIIKCDQIEEKPKVTENIFYRSYEWEILYDDRRKESLRYSFEVNPSAPRVK